LDATVPGAKSANLLGLRATEKMAVSGFVYTSNKGCITQPAADETMMTIHFNADLRPVLKDRVGMLHWITDPACSGFIIGYDLSGNEVLISNFNVRYRRSDCLDS
jgi:hypothetical protein